jgi:hypothetical protein
MRLDQVRQVAEEQVADQRGIRGVLRSMAATASQSKSLIWAVRP